MKYKLGDKFPARWKGDLYEDDGDYWSDCTIIIDGKEYDSMLYVTNILKICFTEGLPPLKEVGVAVLKDIDDYFINFVPEEWINLKSPPFCSIVIVELEDE